MLDQLRLMSEIFSTSPRFLDDKLICSESCSDENFKEKVINDQRNLTKIQIKWKNICVQCPQESYYITGDYYKECDSNCFKFNEPLSSNCTKCKPGLDRVQKN